MRVEGAGRLGFRACREQVALSEVLAVRAERVDHVQDGYGGEEIGEARDEVDFKQEVRVGIRAIQVLTARLSLMPDDGTDDIVEQGVEEVHYADEEDEAFGDAEKALLAAFLTLLLLLVILR